MNPTNLLAQTKTNNETANKFIRELHKDLEQTTPNLRNAHECQNYYANKKRGAVEFNIGDEVLLSIENLNSLMATRGSHKLGALYIGPFKIIKK